MLLIERRIIAGQIALCYVAMQLRTEGIEPHGDCPGESGELQYIHAKWSVEWWPIETTPARHSSQLYRNRRVITYHLYCDRGTQAVERRDSE